jgi:hypothetical protein
MNTSSVVGGSVGLAAEVCQFDAPNAKDSSLEVVAELVEGCRASASRARAGGSCRPVQGASYRGENGLRRVEARSPCKLPSVRLGISDVGGVAAPLPIDSASDQGSSGLERVLHRLVNSVAAGEVDREGHAVPRVHIRKRGAGRGLLAEPRKRIQRKPH